MRMTGRALGMLAVLTVATQLGGCATTPPLEGAKLDGEPRSVILQHPASGETASVTYWRPGDGYDPAAMRQLAVLFRDRRSDEVIPVDPALIDMLVELRQRVGAPPESPIRITSGYRSSITNASLARTNPNVAENSYHMRGQAADFSIAGIPPSRLAEEAAAMQRGGYAMYAHTGHVHVDTGPFRTWTPKTGEPRAPQILEAQARARTRIQALALAQKTTGTKGRVQVADAAAKPGKPSAKPAKAPAKSAAKAPSPDLSRVRVALAQVKEMPVQKTAKR
ncbi:YcbK family protein [Azospirillum sp. YIM B02556]|uniref:Murein endopeptidase K n=2 Tax=Azospirillum endophyticum TaxID=2800326 RepID=A0ABS1FF27_9PROT|nr:YcbK family protein [Azospirillum endophyticum]